MLSQDTPLVGREREQQQLGEVLTAACSGQGRLVLVSGEAGIGKTTLVRDLAGRARQQGALVLSGGCYDLTTTPPYGPWAEAIRGYQPVGELPEIPSWFGNLDELEKLGSQPAIFEAAREFLVAISGKQPLLILLEDLHWTDPASVDALRYLSRTLRDNSILIIATYRDDEPYPNESLLAALPALVRESEPERIELRRWPEPDTRRLIASRYRLRSDDEARLASHAHRLAEGNPFYTVELLRALEGDQTLRRQPGGWALDDLPYSQVPPLVRQVIERRLDRLTDRTRGLLEFAAVIGHDVPFELWRDVSDETMDVLADAVEEALSAQLCDELENRSGIRFRHALIRETLYAGTNPLALGDWHRRVAESLMRQPAVDPDAISFHLEKAGDERSTHWLLRAGRRSQQAAAWKSAASRYIDVADRLKSDSTRARERAWLLFNAGRLLRYADSRRSSDLIEDARREAARVGDRGLEARCLTHQGSNLCHRGDLGRGLANLKEGISIVESLQWSGRFVTDDSEADAVIQSLLSDEDRLEEMAVAASGPGMNPRSFPLRRVLSHWLSESGRFHEAIQTSEELDEVVRKSSIANMPDAAQAVEPHPGLSIAYMMLGMPEKAWDITRQGRLAAEDKGDYFLSACIIFNQLHGIAIPYFTDDLDRREILLNQTAQASARAEEQMRGTPVQTFIQCVADRLEGRWKWVRDQEDALGSVVFSFLRHAMIAFLGELDRLQGCSDSSWDRVYRLLPAGPDDIPGNTLFGPASAAQRLAVDLYLDVGDLDAARAWLEAHDRWLDWSGAVLGQTEGHLLWARYHLLDGDRQQARERAGRSLACASDPRQPLALIATHRFLGELDTHERDDDSAGEHLTTAVKLAEACRAPYEIALTRLAQAELALATRDIPQARRLLGQARETFEDLGAEPALARARQVEANIATRARTYPAGLTPREVEVLCLVADGLSNREIAGQLYLSVRTVERHVTNIYAKIDVANRVDAAAFVRRHDLTELLHH